MAEPRHSGVLIFLYIFAFLAFAANIILNFLHWFGIGQGEIFSNYTSVMRSDYQVDFKLDVDWSFSIMSVAYCYQLQWLILTAPFNFCRITPDGSSYVYVNPGLLSPAFYIFFILACGCDIALLFLWDRGFFDYSLIPNGMSAFFLYLCIGILCARIQKKGKWMVKGGMASHIWIARLVLQNAIGFWAAWASIRTLNQLAILLVHRFGLDSELSGTIALASLGFEIIIYFLLDATVLDRFTRHMYTPYIAPILVLTGMIVTSFEPFYRNTIMTVILLSGVGCLFLGKIMLSFWRCCVFPLFPSCGKYDPEPSDKISNND